MTILLPQKVHKVLCIKYSYFRPQYKLKASKLIPRRDIKILGRGELSRNSERVYFTSCMTN